MSDSNGILTVEINKIPYPINLKVAAQRSSYFEVLYGTINSHNNSKSKSGLDNDSNINSHSETDSNSNSNHVSIRLELPASSKAIQVMLDYLTYSQTAQLPVQHLKIQTPLPRLIAKDVHEYFKICCGTKLAPISTFLQQHRQELNKQTTTELVWAANYFGTEDLLHYSLVFLKCFDLCVES